MADEPVHTGNADQDAADQGLSRVAAAIVSGECVDWRTADSRDAIELADELRILESVTAFHRRLQIDAEPDPAGAPDQWGSLRLDDRVAAGAFGEVFRAWDARLDREVALKLLYPPRHGVDGASAASIEEGRLLARVRHPNVVTVHGADRIGGRVGVWMEFVHGRTLAEITSTHGRFSAQEATAIGRDLCRALSAVHQAGLLHGDIKAQNVMREDGGRLVLMDFGTTQELIARTLTAPDQLTGTPIYLAPELWTGGAATARSDIYSLGVLLFFLVAGTYPVTGATIDAVRAGHRTGQRTLLRDARPDLPPAFVDVVERALSRDPDARYDSAGAFEVALLSAEGSDVHRAWQRRPSVPWAIAGVLAIALAAVVGVWQPWRRSPAPAVTRFVIPLPGLLASPTRPGSSEFAIAIDGSAIAYSAVSPANRPTVQVHPLNDFSLLPPFGGPAGQPFFSPDGRWVGMHRNGSPSQLVRIPARGGPVTTIAEAPNPGGAFWDLDGSIVFSNDGELWRVSESGGPPAPLTTVTKAGGGASAIRPARLPNGDVLFTLRRSGTPDHIMILDRSGHVKPVTDDGKNPKFLPPGFLVFVRGRAIVAAPFDLARESVSGPVVQIQSAGLFDWFDVSTTGTLVYATRVGGVADKEPGQFTWIDRLSGERTALGFSIDSARYTPGSLRLSPDGHYFAIAITDQPEESIVPGEVAAPSRLWIGDTERRTLVPLTVDNAYPIAWTPDGRQVTYRNAKGAIVRRMADASSPEEELLASPLGPFTGCNVGAWTPDGTVLIMRCAGANGAGGKLMMVRRVVTRDSTSDQWEFKPFLVTRFGEGAPDISPDGHWVAYQSNSTGRLEIYVRPVSGSGPVIPVTNDGGTVPMWRGNEIFYTHAQGTKFERLVMTVQTLPTFRVTSGPKPAVADLPPIGATGFAVTRDGRRVLVLLNPQPAGPAQLNVVVNWIEDVKQRLAGRR